MDIDALQTNLGNAIRARREALRFSQDTFADAIGMHRAYYGSIERGERNLTLSTLVRLATGLGVGLGKLLEEAELESC
jgi:transcriptional regulator with XRE-family HTH domain